MEAIEKDVIVVGAGPAGSACALTLARAGLSVLVVDQRNLGAEDQADASAQACGPFTIGESLPSAAHNVLKDLGVWEEFLLGPHLPSHGMISIWETEDAQVSDSIHDANGHGWHLERQHFDAMLRRAAIRAGAKVSFDVRADPEVRSDGSWEVTLDSEGQKHRARCRWLVDATGRRSHLGRRLDAERKLEDHLVCWYALYRQSPEATRRDEDSRGLIEATSTGWNYTSLLPEAQRLVAHFTDSELIRHTNTSDANKFQQAIMGSPFISACLEAHDYRLVCTPEVCAAQSSYLDPAVGEGWLAVGDAAIAFDPLSSQGLLNAICTGISGAEAILASADDPEALPRYREQLATIFQRNRQQLVEAYGRVTRWPDAPFWSRRLAKVGSELQRLH